MRQKFLWQTFAALIMLTFFMLPVSGQADSTTSGQRERYVLDTSRPVKTFPIMRPDDLTIRKWQDRLERAPRAPIHEKYHRRAHPRAKARIDQTGKVSSINLLGLLTYSPSESQGSCGDCWAWAGTRVMGIDLNTQRETADNLSVQFTNSCYGENACCGGWLSDVVDFYNSKLMAIPAANTNASFQDGNFGCSYFGALSKVSCENISTATSYPVKSISEATVHTTGISQAEAISNIKNVLNQGKAIWFAFFLPTETAWNNFYNFWNNQSESALWDSDVYCGKTWDAYDGGGHAVTLVGYDDSSADPEDHYWIALNSWGTTAGRPNGIFRVKMYSNYNCTFSGLSSYTLGFQTLNIEWGVGQADPVDRTAPVVTAFSVPTVSKSLTVFVNAFTAADNVEVAGYMITASSAKPSSSAAGWSATAPTSYTFPSGTLGTKTLYAWAKDAAGNVSSYKSASLTLSMPDLIISAVSNWSTTITASRRSFSITDTNKNQGNALASVSATKYYLSTTTEKTANAVLLGGTRSVKAIAVGKTSRGSAKVTVPNGTAKTVYYVLACADDNSVVSESIESNNCRASTRKITVKY